MTRLLVYAGPNGSGKSSLRDSGQSDDRVDLVIDPDRLARDINPADPRRADREAGRQALLLFEHCLANRRSMSLETTLSGHSVLRRLQAAKAHGYELDLRYIALDLVDLNIQRVRARAAGGGHFIDPTDIRRRYSRSLDNLPTTLAIVDRATVSDNTGLKPRSVLQVAGRRIVHIEPGLPAWLRVLLPMIEIALRLGAVP